MKWCKRFGLGVLGLVTLLLTAGALYQSIESKLEEKRYPPIGQMVDVGGYKLHMYSMGQGGPVVVLDTGLGCPSPAWAMVQPGIAEFTRVISYDRAGNGWSEPSPFPRTSAQIVKELKTLLENAKIPGPYILVGHSFGGNNVQLFAATYPDDVAALVLVDSCHEDQERRLPPNPIDIQAKILHSPQGSYLISTFGIIRFFLHATLKTRKILMPNFPSNALNTYVALCSKANHIQTTAAEASLLPVSFNQLKNADQTRLKEKPCIVLTAGNLIDISAYGIPNEKLSYMKRMFAVWHDLQKELTHKFRKVKQIITNQSDHMIPFKDPQLITESVHTLVINQQVN
jgi:pimeloyl-ACP methyl ester carboxylesterase